jgi:hypothetical protein
MGIPLGGSEDHMLQTNVPWINVDLTASIRSHIFFFKAIGGMFNIREGGNGDEAFESDEVTKKGFSHLLGIIIGKIKGESFADRIGLAKGRTEVLYSLMEDILF